MSTVARPLVSRLELVVLYVRDLERSLAFYRDLLGTDLRGDAGWDEADLGGTRFALHVAADATRAFSSGSVHRDFGVDDVDAASERLQAASIDVGAPMRDDCGSAVEVVDPDGYRISLSQAA